MDALLWVLVVAVLAVAGVLAFMTLRSRRLRSHFGEEYERERAREGRRRAESELAQREKRREGLDVRPLDPQMRDRFAISWRDLQMHFVDAPAETVRASERLVQEVMRARGYPVEEDFEQRAADLSVDCPDSVQHYRDAHRLAKNREPEGTEALRQSMLHYRVLLDVLLETKDESRIVDVRDQHHSAPRPIR